LAHYVGGRYQLIAQLGGGGMADVFLAKLSGKADFAKLAVVKRLKTFEDDDPEILRMFADEARLSARLNHPNIVQTFEVGEDATGPFLVMEYIEGQPLSRIRSRAARREMTIPRAIALEILRDTLAGLSYAHNLIDHDGTPLRVVHRDVSPENIMVTYAGQTKLVDFGVAKTVASMSRTRAGVLKGKVAYMAPEQARSDTTIDERADVFAVGLLLWEMLTTKRLWEGLSEAKVFERLLDDEPLPRTRTVDPEIPEDLDELCAKAMEKDKEKRFATANDLLEALEKACAKHDLRASKREVGQFVLGLFEAEREKVRQLVSNAVAKSKDAASAADAFFLPRANAGVDPSASAKADPEPAKAEASAKAGPAPSADAPAPSADAPAPAKADAAANEAEAAASVREESDPFLFRPISSGSLPGSVDGASEPSQSSETTSGVVEATPRPAAPAAGSGSKTRFVVWATVVLGLVGGALVVGKRLGAQSVVLENPAPSVVVQAAPPPPTSVTADVPEVTIDISVKPSNAKLYIDGNLVANPYHLTTPRAEGTHEIRAEAEGYETRTMFAAWDRDRVVEMTLAKRAPQPPIAPIATAAPKNPTAAPKNPTVASKPSTPAHATSQAAAGTSATASKPTTARGITEIDMSSPKRSEKQDKIDTDVFRR